MARWKQSKKTKRKKTHTHIGDVIQSWKCRTIFFDSHKHISWVCQNPLKEKLKFSESTIFDKYRYQITTRSKSNISLHKNKLCVRILVHTRWLLKSEILREQKLGSLPTLSPQTNRLCYSNRAVMFGFISRSHSQCLGLTMTLQLMWHCELYCSYNSKLKSIFTNIINC